MTERFKPNTTVAAVIVWRDQFLLVQEEDQGKLVLNQAAGHIEPFESIEHAAKREVLEETGLEVEFDHLQGSYYFYSESLNIHFLRFCYVADISNLYAERPQSEPNDDKIKALAWLTIDEINARLDEMRSPMVKLCIDDFIADKKLPNHAITTNL